MEYEVNVDWLTTEAESTLGIAHEGVHVGRTEGRPRFEFSSFVSLSHRPPYLTQNLFVALRTNFSLNVRCCIACQFHAEAEVSHHVSHTNVINQLYLEPLCYSHAQSNEKDVCRR